jgi:hypothetical protein
MAKKTEYTVEKHKLFIDALSIGSSLREACDYAGLSWRTWCEWRQRVAADDRFHAGVASLVDEHEQAMERGRAALLAQLRQHAKKDWRAAAFLVGRRDEQQERRLRVAAARVRLDREKAELQLAALKIAAGGIEKHEHSLTASVVVLPELDGADGSVAPESGAADAGAEEHRG